MHNIQMYENLKDMLEKEVKEISRQGELNTQSLDALYKLMTAIKVADKCIDRESGMSFNSYEGRSNEGRSYGGSYARRGRDGDGDGRYSEEGYSRGRSYESSYRNIREGSKQKMIQKLEMMMDEPMGEEERRALIDCIERIK